MQLSSALVFFEKAKPLLQIFICICLQCFRCWRFKRSTQTSCFEFSTGRIEETIILGSVQYCTGHCILISVTMVQWRLIRIRWSTFPPPRCAECKRFIEINLLSGFENARSNFVHVVSKNALEVSVPKPEKPGGRKD